MSDSPRHPPPISILTVALEHEYGLPGPFSDYTVAPLPATETACRRLGMHLRRTAEGLSLYAFLPSTAPDAIARRITALESATLCWQITPTPSNFSAYTGLEFPATEQCLIFTSNASVAKGGSLTTALNGSATASDLWLRRPLRFDFPLEKLLAPGLPVNLCTGGGVRLRQVATNDSRRLAIDTTERGSGLYRLTQGTTELGRWFGDERGERHPQFGAVLVLAPAVLADALRQATQPSPSSLPQYTGMWPAREVLWRYHIFNTEPDEPLRIEPCDGSPPPIDQPPVVPNPFVAVALPDLPAARSFEMTAPLKLQRRPAQRFALHRGSTGRFTTLPLPALSFGNSARNPPNAALCAEVFVHL